MCLDSMVIIIAHANIIIHSSLKLSYLNFNYVSVELLMR